MSQLPPTNYEKRRGMYKEIESFISPGFLYKKIKIDGINLCVRSMLPRDFFLIKTRSNDNDTNWSKWAVAHTIWMVDGVSVLGDVNFPVKIYNDLLKNLRPSHIKKMLNIQMELNKEMDKNMERTKTYCLEDMSRNIWKQLRGLQLNSPMVTGIPGTENLGLNIIQRIWLIHNNFRDDLEGSKISWDHAKFVASSMNPKGVKSINSKEKNREISEEEKNQEMFDNEYYKYVGLIKDDGILPDGTKIIRKVKSVNELVDEYKNWVDGKLDEHDIAVLEYKESIIRQNYENAISFVDDIESEHNQKITAYDYRQIKDIVVDKIPGLITVHSNDPFDRVPLNGSSIQKQKMGNIQEAVASRKTVLTKK